MRLVLAAMLTLFTDVRADTAAMRDSSVAEVEAKVELTPAIRDSRAADTLAILVAIVLETLAILVAIVLETFAIDVCNATLVVDKVAETVLILVCKAAEVEANVELTPAILVSSVADKAATVEDVAAGSPATNIFVASTVVALIVPALTVVANKLPVRKLLTLTS
jgi:hypothetical protein